MQIKMNCKPLLLLLCCVSSKVFQLQSQVLVTEDYI